MNSLLLPEVYAVLERLHTLADTRDETIVQQVRGDEAAWNAATSEQKAALIKMPCCPFRRRGKIPLRRRPLDLAKRIVEFGTSFGVSTIYFAAALKDNGGGVVIGSELERARLPRRTSILRRRGFPNLLKSVLAMPCKPCGTWAEQWTCCSSTAGNSCTPTC